MALHGCTQAHFEVVQSVILPRPIVFESHSVEVQPSSVEMLLKVLMMLEAHPSFNLLVEGHADANEVTVDSIAASCT